MSLLTSSETDVDSLFLRARGGDSAAWDRLFHECYPKVVRVVRRKLHNPAMRSLFDSTDFASDVMKSLAANAKHLDFPSFNSLMSFLSKVAEQKVVDEYRKALTQKRDISRKRSLGQTPGGADAPGTEAALASPEPTASQVAQASEAHDLLMAGQDDVRRRVIELKRQNYSVAEIAAETGWNIRKVQRFLQDLKESYRDQNRDAR